ncbi:hypothetical protein U5640_36480 [Streptomyces sp. SS7]|uniref:hypothetical protein n=1 Tax=Streptomyces sp. SS7 TaxID=3108485 RepID=UPI0030EBCA2B
MLTALCAALAVLVHHDVTAMTAMTSQRAAAPLSMPGMVTAATAGHEGHPFTSSPDTSPSRSDRPSAAPATPAVSADHSLCCSGGAQHCGAASVETVTLSPPAETSPGSAAMRPFPSCGPMTTRSTERAPPDLSVLSRLRI